ncbi:MAG: hypothetical protein M1818_001021 [Claussenomyces sp. TS43310]|nr:MAG: hypothetical protein M1818_001021 [Claussenomyces sp. TS43310]
MGPKPIAILKFVGSISLGLLTGVSYTLSTIALPSLLTLPSASSASHALTHLGTRALTDLRIWASVATTSFLAAYLLSPRGARHPYLLWTALLGASSALTDLVRPPHRSSSSAPRRSDDKQRRAQPQPLPRGIEASYEVLGDGSSDAGGALSATASDTDEDVNGEEVRAAMEHFRRGQTLRTAVAGLAFAMSVVGIWGDGYSAFSRF